MNDEWILIPQLLEPEDQPVTLNSELGVAVTVFVSPYDVPKAVRGYIDTKKNLRVIEFRYPMANEPKEEKAIGPVTFFVGKKSRRLYRMELDRDQIPTSGFTINIFANAIDSLEELETRPVAKKSYEIAKVAVSKAQQELEPILVGQ